MITHCFGILLHELFRYPLIFALFGDSIMSFTSDFLSQNLLLRGLNQVDNIDSKGTQEP